MKEEMEQVRLEEWKGWLTKQEELYKSIYAIAKSNSKDTSFEDQIALIIDTVDVLVKNSTKASQEINVLIKKKIDSTQLAQIAELFNEIDRLEQEGLVIADQNLTKDEREAFDAKLAMADAKIKMKRVEIAKLEATLTKRAKK